MMIAMVGFSAAMYVKFCSGPTPMYTRPCFAIFSSGGMMFWKLVSFERRLSERNTPSSSDHSFDKLQNWSFVSLSGAGGAACPRVTSGATLEVHKTKHAMMKMENLGALIDNLKRFYLM